jgi:nitrogen fixation protein FixH
MGRGRLYKSGYLINNIRGRGAVDCKYINKMRRRRMKKIAALTMVLLLIAGIVYAKNYEVKKKAGDYNVVATIDKNPPVAGDNVITIAVKDTSGKAVTDAKVKVEYSMPAMAGMPAMNYKADAKLADDEYKATMNLSMSGAWNVAVKITKSGKTSTMKFNLDAQ